MADDPLLRQLAANQFYAGTSDPRAEAANVLRAVLGVGRMEQTGPLPFDALRSSESVDVSATVSPNEPFPEGMDAIFLGGRTSAPTGTHLPQRSSSPSISPEAQQLWERVLAQYPHAANFVSRVTIGDPGSGARGKHANGEITLSPRAGFDTLTHELAHAAADQQFTDPDDRLSNYSAGGGTWGMDYQNRRGERVARAVSEAARRRLNDESDERSRQRMKKQYDDYMAGRGPRPDWL